MTSSLFPTECHPLSVSVSNQWLEYSAGYKSPLAFCFNVIQPFCLFAPQPQFAGKELQRSIGNLNLCTTTWKSFFYIDVVSMKMKVKKYYSLEKKKKKYSQELCSSTLQRLSDWNPFVDNLSDSGRILICWALEKLLA